MAEGEGLERPPGAEFIAAGVDAEQQVLVADAVPAFAVDARLVGSYHSGKQRRGVEVLPDVLGAFVDSEEISYAVAGAVAEIAVAAPERLAREGVDLALREGRPVKVLHVVNPDAAPIGEPAINAQALDYLYALSGEAGAEMCVLTSKAPVTAIANYANECGARHVVMGGGERARGIAETLSQLLPGVRVMIMERE